MPQLTGYCWDVISSADEKKRVVTEGRNLDEALAEFRRIHGYTIDIFQIKYHCKIGGEIE